MKSLGKINFKTTETEKWQISISNLQVLKWWFVTEYILHVTTAVFKQLIKKIILIQQDICNINKSDSDNQLAKIQKLFYKFMGTQSTCKDSEAVLEIYGDSQCDLQ